MMNKILLFLAIGFATGMLSCSQQTLEKTDSLPQTYTISQERLLDKIGFDLVIDIIGMWVIQPMSGSRRHNAV